MELTEVVSPSVAVPVLCVLVCAFLVFAFGFKSPAQPPSFDVFDDDSKKKRVKKSKVDYGNFTMLSSSSVTDQRENGEMNMEVDSSTEEHSQNDTYSSEKEFKKSTLWSCSVRSKTIRCHVTVTEIGGQFHFGKNSKHVHPGDLGALSKVRCSVQIVPHPFRQGQLFSIHGFILHDGCAKQVPLAFVLMSKRRKEDYLLGSKSQSNGHAVVAGESDVNTNAKPQASPRQAAKAVAKVTTQQVVKSKSAQQVPQEAPKKVKKQGLKEEGKKPETQEPGEDVGLEDWHTVPKKDKKLKKKESESKKEKQEVPVKEEEIVEKVVEPVTASVEVVPEVVEAPQDQRSKKKKEKKTRKPEPKEEVEEPEVVVIEEPKHVIPEVPPPAPEVVHASIELEIQDAMETTVENETVTEDKKRRNKKDKKKALPTPEEDDFVIPQAAIKPDVIHGLSEDTPLKDNTEALTVKIPKKKQKKERNKKTEEKLEEKVEKVVSGKEEPSLSQSHVSNTPPKKTKLKETSLKEEPPAVETSRVAESGVTPAAEPSDPQPTATFDELGGTTDSWTEAKPKSKKKKARRAD